MLCYYVRVGVDGEINMDFLEVLEGVAVVAVNFVFQLELTVLPSPLWVVYPSLNSNNLSCR